MRALESLKGILKKITSMAFKFFFHGNDQNKIHMISWDRSTLPHYKGGMGLLCIT